MSIVVIAAYVFLFGDNYFHINIIPIEEIDEIITDNNLDKDFVKEIEDKKIKLTLV